MLWETEDRNMDPYALELNLFVDTILAMVYRLGGKRNITFSSFCPEICISLVVKQSQYPILFISKAGSVPVGDIRAGSLQQAIHFAEAWGLAGIVMLSDVFVMCPRLIRYARSRGLVCGSYGDLNDEPKNAKVREVVPKVFEMGSRMDRANYVTDPGGSRSRCPYREQNPPHQSDSKGNERMSFHAGMVMSSIPMATQDKV